MPGNNISGGEINKLEQTQDILKDYHIDKQEAEKIKNIADTISQADFDAFKKNNNESYKKTLDAIQKSLDTFLGNGKIDDETKGSIDRLKQKITNESSSGTIDEKKIATSPTSQSETKNIDATSSNLPKREKSDSTGNIPTTKIDKKEDIKTSASMDAKMEDFIKNFEEKFGPEVKKKAEIVLRELDNDVQNIITKEIIGDLVKGKAEIVNGMGDIITQGLEKNLFQTQEYKNILYFAGMENYNTLYNDAKAKNILEKKEGSKYNIEKTFFINSPSTLLSLEKGISHTASSLLKPIADKIRKNITDHINNKEQRKSSDLKDAMKNKDSANRKTLQENIENIIKESIKGGNPINIDTLVQGKKDKEGKSLYKSPLEYVDSSINNIQSLFKDIPLSKTETEEFNKILKTEKSKKTNDEIQKVSQELLGGKLEFKEGKLNIVDEKGNKTPFTLGSAIMMVIGKLFGFDMSSFGANSQEKFTVNSTDAKKLTGAVLEEFNKPDSQKNATATDWLKTYNFAKNFEENTEIKDKYATNIATMKGIDMDKLFGILDTQKIPYEQALPHSINFLSKHENGDIVGVAPQNNSSQKYELTAQGKQHYKNYILRTYLEKVQGDTHRQNLSGDHMLRDLTTFIISGELDTDVSNTLASTPSAETKKSAITQTKLAETKEIANKTVASGKKTNNSNV